MRFIAIFIASFLLTSFAVADDTNPLTELDFSTSPITGDDIRELLQLNTYKFRVSLKDGEKLRFTIRKFSEPDKPPKNLWQHIIEKGGGPCNSSLCDPYDPDYATIRIDFHTGTGPMQPALSTQLVKLGLTVNADSCTPSGIHGTIANPLAELSANEKTWIIATSPRNQLRLRNPDDENIQRLIYLSPTEEFLGLPVGNGKKWDELFPRAEVIIQRIDSDNSASTKPGSN